MTNLRMSFLFWLAVGAPFVPQHAVAQNSPSKPKADLGRLEFESKCATCHGLTGKGDGPIASFLTKKPADLTGLAKANGGVIPVATMYEIILGDRNVAAHGPRDMPAWGQAYRIQAGEYFVDTPYDPDAYIRARILTVIEYISRLQAR